MLGSLPEVPELPGYGVGQQKLASRHGLHLHINRLAGSHHRIVVHLELLNATRRQKPICRVEEEGIDLYGLSIGRMGRQVDVAGVGGPGVAQIIHQVLGAGTTCPAPQRTPCSLSPRDWPARATCSLGCANCRRGRRNLGQGAGGGRSGSSGCRCRETCWWLGWSPGTGQTVRPQWWE